MRARRLLPLSVVALATLIAAGCAPDGDADTAPTPTAGAGAECLVGLQPGEPSDAIAVTGDADTIQATVPAGTDLGVEMHRSIVTVGDGDDVVAGDLVNIAYRFYSATTGEELDSSLTNPAAEDGTMPVNLDPQSYSLFLAAIECAPLGSVAVATFPSEVLGEGAEPLVVVAQAVSEFPSAAWGEERPAVDGMPTVTLADDGTPSVEIPDAEAPAELEVAVLKQGDGAVVRPGDTTILQYHGVAWETGESFDSSWERDGAISIPGNTYVEGFVQAIEGQQAGSQVLVVIPPELGYGDDPEAHALGGQTLVFVVDILATQHSVQD